MAREMTDAEALKEAVKRAVENGWHKQFICEGTTKEDLIQEAVSDITCDFDIRGIIFGHQFAKAFFGEEKSIRSRKQYVGEEDTIPDWQYHLQRLVLEENPITYLKEYMEGKR